MTPVDLLIERAIALHAFPAAAIEVGRRDRVLWNAAFGRLTYAPDAPATVTGTIFDLASLTKVIATATLVMRAIDAGTLSLDDRIANRLPDWRGSDREHVTIADLLEHASGLTAYLPFFRDHHNRAEFERAICALPLEYAPRTQSIYSDLGFILLGFILEDVNCAPLATQFDDLFRLKAETTERGGSKAETTERGGSKAEATGQASEAKRPSLGDKAERSSLESGSFRLQAEEYLAFRVKGDPAKIDRARFAPTELDLWRGRLLQGEVHDENAWTLGGAAGHAGLFGTAGGVGAFARLVLDGLCGDARDRALAAPETLARFARRSTVPGSSRALAWDTMLPTSSCGTRLSPRAIGHPGFTGTSLWIDPAQDLYIVLLTNRVHPTRENNLIQQVRREVHDAVSGSLGNGQAQTANSRPAS
jgi:CubicO group peptidase (beta-lactamase class C family)